MTMLAMCRRLFGSRDTSFSKVSTESRASSVSRSATTLTVRLPPEMTSVSPTVSLASTRPATRAAPPAWGARTSSAPFTTTYRPSTRSPAL